MPAAKQDDSYWMHKALTQARKALGRTSPNPCVGAVIVRNGSIVGQGYHPAAGQPHAEILALRQAGPKARGATLYVTLEPCNHQGRTGPCAPAIVQAGIRRVVAAMPDPNRRVSGRGLATLKRSGLAVDCGVCRSEAMQMNAGFIKAHTAGLPLVTLKLAMTLDGKIATAQGESRWISSEKSRLRVQRMRLEHDAVMIGVGTALADDPRLTCRLAGGRDPQRIIVDSRARLPATARLLRQRSEAATWVAATGAAPPQRLKRLQEAGARILQVPSRQGRVDLEALLRRLVEQHVLSVLLEGGADLAWSALDGGLVDRVVLFLSPRLLGGAAAPTAVGGPGRRLAEAFRLRDPIMRRIGEDFLLEGDVIPSGSAG